MEWNFQQKQFDSIHNLESKICVIETSCKICKTMTFWRKHFFQTKTQKSPCFHFAECLTVSDLVTFEAQTLTFENGMSLLSLKSAAKMSQFCHFQQQAKISLLQSLLQMANGSLVAISNFEFIKTKTLMHCFYYVSTIQTWKWLQSCEEKTKLKIWHANGKLWSKTHSSCCQQTQNLACDKCDWQLSQKSLVWHFKKSDIFIKKALGISESASAHLPNNGKFNVMMMWWRCLKWMLFVYFFAFQITISETPCSSPCTEILLLCVWQNFQFTNRNGLCLWDGKTTTMTQRAWCRSPE